MSYLKEKQSIIPYQRIAKLLKLNRKPNVDIYQIVYIKMLIFSALSVIIALSGDNSLTTKILIVHILWII